MSKLVPIYQHHAPNPDRFYYDTNIQGNSGWSEGIVVFYAYSTQEPGTIPLYQYHAYNPERFCYDSSNQASDGWDASTVAFYAYPAPMPNTIPIYNHHIEKDYRSRFDQKFEGGAGWSDGMVAFYAYPTQWMSAISGNTLLSQLTLPGTHESMAINGGAFGKSKCQNWSLGEQLTNGLRVFDIRLRYLVGKNGNVNFSIHHAGDYQNAYFSSAFRDDFPDMPDTPLLVLNQCLEFLQQNPDESIVLLIKQEKDQQVRHTFFEAFWKIVKAHIPPGTANTLFYEGNTVPRLNQVRGRIIFAFVDGDSGDAYKLTNPTWGLYWGNMDYQVDPDNRLPSQQPGLDVENHWRDGMNEKWNKVEPHLTKALNNRTPSTWFLTFVSASSLYGPESYADYLRPKLQHYLKVHSKNALGPWPAGGFFGTVLMDFPTQDLINLLISASHNN